MTLPPPTEEQPPAPPKKMIVHAGPAVLLGPADARALLASRQRAAFDPNFIAILEGLAQEEPHESD